MSNKGGKKGSDQENNDLTRIEDLSEFLHEEDSSIEERFQNFSTDIDSPQDEPPAIPEDNVFETQSLEESAEEIPEVPFESSEELLFESSEEPNTDISFSEEDNLSQELSDISEDSDVNLDFSDQNSDETSSADLADEFQKPSQDYIEAEETEIFKAPEKFDDVKTFAQNFSYGQVQGAGNPPYSIIVRHIKYKDDADHILELLKEFAIVNEQNEAETIKALEFGSLIIPQISEYCAIVLSHKLRRFDLDLEVGLSDEIHPSKEEGGNPRGLLKKDNLKQNKVESLKLKEIGNSIKDIIVSTSPSIPQHSIKEYLGIQTVFSLVEESELEKLEYVQKTKREKTPLFDYDDASDNSPTTEKAFNDYQNSFTYIYEDLTNQLKQKALKEKANALLGVNFQLSPVQFNRSERRINAYQITCSATLAIVMKEAP